MIMLPVIVLIVVGVLLFSFVGSAVANVANGGEIVYDEETFQNYADRQYQAEFSSSKAYENNLLLVVLTNEEADGYYAIAWIGDNVKSDISNMFGNEYTEFGRAMQNSINTEYYAYSLDTGLAAVMETMTAKVQALNLESSFRSNIPDSNKPTSHLTNYTSFSLSADTVNAALTAFTEATDIPVVIVVQDMETVFGRTTALSDIVAVIVLLVIAAVAIYFIVRAVRNRKNGDNDGQNNGYDQNQYHNNSSW